LHRPGLLGDDRRGPRDLRVRAHGRIGSAPVRPRSGRRSARADGAGDPFADRGGVAVAMQPRLRPVGVIPSELDRREPAPRQGSEGAPDAWLEVHPWAAEALEGIRAGDGLIVITWLHEADRRVLKVHPRSDPRNPLTGVFATRSPDRPNPLGLHPVKVIAV